MCALCWQTEDDRYNQSHVLSPECSGQPPDGTCAPLNVNERSCQLCSRTSDSKMGKVVRLFLPSR
ncbi:hypothetical protein C2E21_8804 [Chlorella sorokiniana]|uniref:Uncharacterized protein n=1 Tax=Chlorella sorokiniana TaxID=3076 RepID=A0A2P6TDA1_CHLSO|nr:hypothetical protein C2E21_8804 [Chlorella sorokiniana]|eukprot:PRW20617.1 hypothetical protein C2E21_8804 [Chlorella sorokiniana]